MFEAITRTRTTRGRARPSVGPAHARPILALIAAMLATCAAGAAAQREVDDRALRDPPAEEWLTYGRDYAETHYSPLAQIDATNVSRLEAVWSWEIPKRGARQETTPLVSNGTLFATGPMSFVFALDARTGVVLWAWDPGIAFEEEGGPIVCCGHVNRGVALYRGRVYVGLLDGRLVALDRQTGRVDWVVQTTPPGPAYSITGAPRVIDGKVIIGNGGAEFGVRGYVSAYDADDGDLAWRFHTVPGNPSDGFESEAMRAAAATWSGEWWVAGGGGTPWDGMAYDPEADLLYVGTGNGSPWSRDLRSPGGGDNLYLSSIVALDPDDGELAWHFQTTPGDDWDYTATQPLMLLDLTIGGRERHVIVQTPKNGFFYVLDRLTGELISAEPFADDLTWATRVDPVTGRPVETPEARYGTTGVGVYLAPGPTGAHSWHPNSFNPATGLVYVPAQNNNAWYEKLQDFDFEPRTWSSGTVLTAPRGARRPSLEGPRRVLLAWDPVRNAEVWRAPSEGENGGTLSTAGNLVFRASRDRLVAHDARTGEELWSAEVGDRAGTPITYGLDGRQYVSIAGGSERGTVWTFALDGGR